MPRGRSTFTKRQKEVDEAEELRQMREHAAEQAALFGIGHDDDEPSSIEVSIPPRHQG